MIAMGEALRRDRSQCWRALPSASIRPELINVSDVPSLEAFQRMISPEKLPRHRRLARHRRIDRPPLGEWHALSPRLLDRAIRSRLRLAMRRA
jgi:hypothetical protein